MGGDFPKQHGGQFPNYTTNSVDFITPSIDTSTGNDFVDIEPMWSLPKFSSYEALLKDEEDLFFDSYKLSYNTTSSVCGMLQPNAVRNHTNPHELNHFNSVSNLVYPI